jgi:hypothetical protein
MKLAVKLVMIISLIAILTGSLAACSNSQSDTPTPNSVASTSPTANNVFQISNLAINPAEVNAGVQVLIAAKVTNTGSTEDDYQGNIRIDSETEKSLPAFLPSTEVKIAAGETQLLSAITTVNNPGTYKVSWDNVSQTLIVNPEETPAATNSQSAGPSPAPDFSAVDVVTGKTVSLSQYKGSAILLNFVNYGCDPSTNQRVGAQLLAIKQLQSQRSDFVPFSVFCGCCPPEVLRQFAKENKLNWPWILDSDYSIASKYASSLKKFGYPTLIFIDKDQLITEVTGSTDLAGLDEKINKLAIDLVK